MTDTTLSSDRVDIVLIVPDGMKEADKGAGKLVLYVGYALICVALPGIMAFLTLTGRI